MSETKIVGGCQCGQVRYEATMPPENVHFCHCRMCQKAFGNVFAALVPFKRSHLHFTTRPPQVFRSSSIAERGFCGTCGTPLTFAYLDSEWMSVSLGSLDRPQDYPIQVHFGVESQVPWLHFEDGLPRETSEADSGRLDGMTSYQHRPD